MSPFYRISILIIFISKYSCAQFHDEKFLRSSLLLSYENQPERNFIAINSKYQLSKYELGFNLPLYNKVRRASDQGAFRLTGIVFNLKASRTDPSIDFIHENHKLSHLGSGLDFIVFPGRRTLYLFSANANIFRDNYLSGSPSFRYTGFAIANYRVSQVTSLKGGIGYSFLFGRATPLPILGARFSFKSKTDINIILPFYAGISQKLNDYCSLSIYLKPDGAVFDFANGGNFIDENPVIQLRLKSFKTVLNFSYRFDENLKFFAEGGLVARSSVAFSDAAITSNNNFFEADLQNGYFIRAGVFITFGSEPTQGKENGVNFMLDYDVNGTEMKE